MKFDMAKAWSDATAMLSANRDLVLVVAGVFFFLPNLAMVLMMPDMSSELPMAMREPGPGGADPQVMADAFLALYSRIWPYLLAVAILQAIGSLSLLALLRDSTRPTLGEALKLGLTAFLPYVAAQLLFGFAMGIVAIVLVGGAAAVNEALGLIAFAVFIAAAVYLGTRFSLSMPVIGIERLYNPIAALVRSWKLTRGNALRLFLFFFLIVIAGTIVTIVIEMVLGLLFALFGAEGQLIANGILSSLLNAALVGILLAVLASAHRQLTR